MEGFTLDNNLLDLCENDMDEIFNSMPTDYSGIKVDLDDHYMCHSNTQYDYNSYDTNHNCDVSRDSLNFQQTSHCYESDSLNQHCVSGNDEQSMEDDMWSTLLQQAVIHDDPMMSDTSCQPLARANSDHCYSASEEQTKYSSKSHTHTNSSMAVRINKDSTISQPKHSLRTVKMEPRVITVQSSASTVYDGKSGRTAQSLLKQGGNSLVRTVNTTPSNRLIYPITRIKSEPKAPSEEDDVYADHMPITPPSSNQSSDSEGGTSPRHSPPTSPVRQVLVARATGYRYNPATAIYSQPIPTSGVLRLTEEEKRTFITEGYPLPSKLPLTKAEERNLKKVRRKIKNKISAQESRRKKKEYMDQLERKVEDIIKENHDLKQKCDKFENSNRSLMNQLSKLQAVLKRFSPKQVTTQAGTCLLVMVLCFAVFIGDWMPLSSFSSVSQGDSHSQHYSMLDSHMADNSYNYMQTFGGRTLTSLAEEELAYQEPWLISMAKHTFEWTIQLINGSSLTSQQYVESTDTLSPPSM